MRPTTIKGPGVLLLCIGIALLFGLPAAAGKIYRWVDENGQLHFSDSPHNAPVDRREQAKEYKPNSSSLSITENNPQPTTTPSTDNNDELVDEGLARDSISIPYTAKEGAANRVIIDITFNDSVTAPILVDTGSPGLIITTELATQLGLFEQEGSQLMVLISGIGGQQTAIRTIVEKLSIDKITEEFVPAHIVPKMSNAYQGLIGMDILANYRLTIDTSNQRLIANTDPATQNLPGGRSKSWWQNNFREFAYYGDFWEQQAALLEKSGSPYAQLAPSEKQRLKKFIQQQQNEAETLLTQLERFARWRSVPRHWRR